MNKKIERNYIEITSLEDLNDSKNFPEGYIFNEILTKNQLKKVLKQATSDQ